MDGCTPAEYHAERYQLLSEAIQRLKQQPHMKVYLDAGNPGWIREARKLAEPLKRAGIAQADGFALNVSNFQTDETTKAYGRRLSEDLGGKHFVMDTSRNGNGPLAGDREQAWCNPPGRALGTPPTKDNRRPAGRRLPVDQASRRVGRTVPGRPGGGPVVAGLRAGPGPQRQGVAGDFSLSVGFT